MYKGGRIIAFLLVFCLLATAPFWLSIGRAEGAPLLSLDTPVISQLAEPRCVEDAAYMRAEHMRLLNEWRDQAVREGRLEYINSGGEIFTLSLDESCLQCHSNRAEFCDACHNYAAVDPYCWDCHDGGAAAP
ncbi:MAG: sulfate reduction electron transfer complex DsrMKJOP subunit DsrJ [Gracilibacteraceae bacterium]|nr:sulfate reduction electron transfer complex DsrMKJOP subunit DsrJ [Gracilibacteraceae bacterium]